MYIFQEMVDTERDYVKSLQYIMDVSKHYVSRFFGPSVNRPFPSCLFPLVQNKSWGTTFHMEMSFFPPSLP